MSPRGVQTSPVKKSAPAMAPQCARRNVRQEDGRSGAGGIPLTLSTLAIVPRPPVAQVRQCPLVTRVALPRMLRGHPDDQRGEVLPDSWATRPLWLERPLPGDQLPVPSQDRVGHHDGRDLPQDPSTESATLRREASALVVGQPEAAPLDLRLGDTVLLHCDAAQCARLSPTSAPWRAVIGSARRARSGRSVLVAVRLRAHEAFVRVRGQRISRRRAAAADCSPHAASPSAPCARRLRAPRRARKPARCARAQPG
jgi:hypothetical protein